ncbi:unnamed protein product [Brugia timori]|uniref:Protein kinase domain-containing protein n=1 Tax=Brugia timori TaxID=42155 RepID=A0A0R3QFQ9_9BILA|nr:unnamed protein product [Brugia timori]
MCSIYLNNLYCYPDVDVAVRNQPFYISFQQMKESQKKFINICQFLAPSQRTTRQFRYFSMQTVEFAVPSDSTDELSTVEYLGGGSFGNVIKITNFICVDGRRTVVAIKKLYEPFRDEKTALRVHREIRLLQMMVHENIVRLLDLYTPDNSLSTLSIV